jgi:hypothetical protein
MNGKGYDGPSFRKPYSPATTLAGYLPENNESFVVVATQVIPTSGVAGLEARRQSFSSKRVNGEH